MEIEAKFSFREPAAFEAWRERPTLGPFVLGPERTRFVVDEYADGPQRECQAGGYACRIRRDGDRVIATLKSLEDAQPGDHASVRRRDELEVALRQPAPEHTSAVFGQRLPEWQQPARWPESDARNLALHLLGGAPLQHLATLRQVRHEREVHDAGRRVALLSLDRVRFDTGRPEILELEAELATEGREPDMQRIVASLHAEPSFEPAPRSKLGQALAGAPHETAQDGIDAANSTSEPHRESGAAGSRAAAPAAPNLAAQVFDATAGLCRLEPKLNEAARRVLAAADSIIPAGAATRPGAPYEAARDLALARPLPDLSANEIALLAGLLHTLAAPPSASAAGETTPLSGPTAWRQARELATLTEREIQADQMLAAVCRLARSLDGAALAASVLTERRLTLYLQRGERSGTAEGFGAGECDRAGLEEARTAFEDTLGVRLRLETLAPGRRRPAGLHFDAPLAEAGRALIAVQIEAMRAAQPGVKAGDEEALHDMRVAVRRMRSLLKLLRRAYPGHVVRPVSRQLKDLGDRLGAVRDLDVLLHRLARETHEAPAQSTQTDIDALFEAMHAEHDAARQKLLDFLDGERLFVLHTLLDGFLRSDLTGKRGAERVCDAAPALLWRQFATVRAYEPIAEGAELDKLHALRKDAKQFRYGLEFFRPVLDSEASDLIDRVVAVQDVLGSLHDAAVLRDRLLQRLDGGEGNQPGISFLLNRTLVALAEHRREFESLWPDVYRRGFRRRLGKALAAL